jgi:membrane-associated protease RseP (regulator of RpoE activity)
MKLLKIALFAALVPGPAFAQTPSEQPAQPSQPAEESGANTPDRDTSMATTAFGLTAKPLSADKRSTYGGPKDAGLLVTKVESGGAAATAGVKVGDVITKIDDAPMATTDDLTKAWQQGQKANKPTAAFEVVRDHETKNLQLSLGQKPQEPKHEMQPKQDMPSKGY